MKLYKCDWNVVLKVCGDWNSLNREDRYEFNRIARESSVSSFPAKSISENTAYALMKAGLLEHLKTKPGTLRLTNAGDHMRRFLTDLLKVPNPVANPENEECMTEYVHSLLSMGERLEFLDDVRASGLKSRELSRRLAKRVSEPSWVLSFIRGDRTSEAGKDKVFETAKKIISIISSAGGLVVLDELYNSFIGSERAFLVPVLKKAVASLLIFPALGVDYRIFICLQQDTLNELHRESSKPPESFSMEGLEVYTPLLDDMALLLVEASSTTIRVRQNDGAVFVRTMEKLKKALHPFHGFFDGLLDSNREVRINLARLALSRMRYLEERGLEEGRLILQPTDNGKEWLVMSRNERLRAVLQWINDYMSGRFDNSIVYRDNHFNRNIFPDYAPKLYTKYFREIDLRKEILSYFSVLDKFDCVWADELFRYFSGEAVTLKIDLDQEHEVIYLEDTDYVAEVVSERVFSKRLLSCLHDFFINVLLMLGCMDSRYFDDERLAVRLNDAGRFLLGLNKDFKLEDKEQTNVIIQPDFSVVFMSPSPAAESVIAPLSERIGREVGELFRITGENVLKVASSGITADKIISDLEEISGADLPKNVRKQIKDWCGQCRKLTSEPAILIRCPDSETALRVKAQWKKSVEQLSDTVLAVPDRRVLRKLKVKLREKGITFE